MFGNLFNPQNSFWQTIDRLSDLLILSLLWLICSLPLVTVGAASTALYDTAAHCFRGQELRFLLSGFVTFAWGVVSVYDAFLQALHGGGWQGRRVFSAEVEPLYAQPVPVTVHVWEISRRQAAC